MKPTDFNWTEIATAQDGSRREYGAPLVGDRTLYRLRTPGGSPPAGTGDYTDRYWLGSWAGPGRTLAEIDAEVKASAPAEIASSKGLGTGKAP